MTCEYVGPRPLDYLPCRYGASRVTFRGPRADLHKDHVLFLGGTTTYGKFIAEPFPALTHQTLGITAVNLGVCNSGPDLYLNDTVFTALVPRATATVIELPGIQNLSNRYYHVHPRRNDRFLTASPLLQTIFRDVEFADFHFTGHLMTHLHLLDPVRFAVVQVELRQAWLARLLALIKAANGPVILLNLHAPYADDALAPTKDMIDALRPEVACILDVPPSDAALREGTDRMIFTPMEHSAAQAQLSQRAHHEIAEALTPVLRPFVPDHREPMAAE